MHESTMTIAHAALNSCDHQLGWRTAVLLNSPPGKNRPWLIVVMLSLNRLGSRGPRCFAFFRFWCMCLRATSPGVPPSSTINPSQKPEARAERKDSDKNELRSAFRGPTAKKKKLTKQANKQDPSKKPMTRKACNDPSSSAARTAREAPPTQKPLSSRPCPAATTFANSTSVTHPTPPLHPKKASMFLPRQALLMSRSSVFCAATSVLYLPSKKARLFH